MATAPMPLLHGKPCDETQILERIADLEAVRVEGDLIVLDPAAMAINKYYFAMLDGEPYLYRKINEREVEVYGLAEEPDVSNTYQASS